jgi:hypothetical protein
MTTTKKKHTHATWAAKKAKDKWDKKRGSCFQKNANKRIRSKRTSKVVDVTATTVRMMEVTQ